MNIPKLQQLIGLFTARYGVPPTHLFVNEPHALKIPSYGTVMGLTIVEVEDPSIEMAVGIVDLQQ